MFYSEVGNLFAQFGKKREKDQIFFFRMFVWKLGWMFWHLERNFLTKVQRNFAHCLKTIWKNEEDFGEDIFSRKIFEHVQCTFDNSARKFLSRNFLAGKPKKNKSWNKSFTRRVVKKVKKLSENNSTRIVFWTLRSSFDKLGASFVAGSARSFQSESAKKDKRKFFKQELVLLRTFLLTRTMLFLQACRKI